MLYLGPAHEKSHDDIGKPTMDADSNGNIDSALVQRWGSSRRRRRTVTTTTATTTASTQDDPGQVLKVSAMIHGRFKFHFDNNCFDFHCSNNY